MLSTLILAMLLQTPAAKSRPPADPFAASNAATERIRTAQKRKEAAAAKKSRYAAARAREAKLAREWQLYVERVGPIIAAQQREAWLLQMEYQRTAAMTAIAGAAQADAVTNRAELHMRAAKAGYPFVPVPGRGMVPYPYTPMGTIP